jgi:hypothetical protein
MLSTPTFTNGGELVKARGRLDALAFGGGSRMTKE